MTASIHYLRAAIGPAVAILIFEASQATADPSCGDTITADVTPPADLKCTDPIKDGLIIGGDGVTLDLNGHTIAGPGIVGVRITGTNATVTNTRIRPGTIKAFEYGVDVLEWLAAVSSHVPDTREQTVRYYWYYSSVSPRKRKGKNPDEWIPCILKTEGSSKQCRKN